MIGWHHNYFVFCGSNNIFADFTFVNIISNNTPYMKNTDFFFIRSDFNESVEEYRNQSTFLERAIILKNVSSSLSNN